MDWRLKYQTTMAVLIMSVLHQMQNELITSQGPALTFERIVTDAISRLCVFLNVC